MLPWIVGGLTAPLAVVLIGVLYQVIAACIAVRKYPAPGRRIQVNGRKLHIYCTGSGVPPVVMISGGGGSCLDWSWVQSQIAEFTTACTYDRASFGWSDPSPAPRSGKQMASELHTLLVNAGIQPPYVLVGHSIGGMAARLYCHQFQEEVAGLVLIDAGHEKAYSQFPAMYWKLLEAQSRILRLAHITTCVGLPRLLRRPMSAQKLPASIQPMANAIGFRAAAYRTAREEILSLKETIGQLRATNATLGDMPLVVLSARIASEHLPRSLSPEDMNRVWMETQVDLAKLSSNSRHVIAKNSSHYIHIDRPELVIEAVRHVVEQARAVQ